MAFTNLLLHARLLLLFNKLYCIVLYDRQTDGRTDGETELLYQYRLPALICWRAIIKGCLNRSRSATWNQLDSTTDLMPRNLGRSPGADDSLSLVRLRTWLIDRTVAATNHGVPSTEQTAICTAIISRSRWYPAPFCQRHNSHNALRFVHFLLITYLLTTWRQGWRRRRRR